MKKLTNNLIFLLEDLITECMVKGIIEYNSKLYISVDKVKYGILKEYFFNKLNWYNNRDKLIFSFQTNILMCSACINCNYLDPNCLVILAFSEDEKNVIMLYEERSTFVNLEN